MLSTHEGREGYREVRDEGIFVTRKIWFNESRGHMSHKQKMHVMGATYAYAFGYDMSIIESR